MSSFLCTPIVFHMRCVLTTWQKWCKTHLWNARWTYTMCNVNFVYCRIIMGFIGAGAPISLLLWKQLQSVAMLCGYTWERMMHIFATAQREREKGKKGTPKIYYDGQRINIKEESKWSTTEKNVFGRKCSNHVITLICSEPYSRVDLFFPPFFVFNFFSLS